MEVPSYTKVLTLGAQGTERALVGNVVVQEKIDGSQFAFGISHGEIGCRSHHQQIDMDNPGMFKEAVEHVRSMGETLRRHILADEEAWFYCEYLQKPKHNTLAYERVPKNHLVLFDAFLTGRERLQEIGIFLPEWADILEVDSIPFLYKGEATVEQLKPLLQTPSYLGGTAVEGVVIKNYNELIALGGRTYPLFCKLVNEAFKERNQKNWHDSSRKSRLETFMESFATEARWRKAVQSLEEEGKLEHEPKDIGALIRAIGDDVVEEDAEDIKGELYEIFIRDVLKSATKGFPEWYKAQLVERLNV